MLKDKICKGFKILLKKSFSRLKCSKRDLAILIDTNNDSNVTNV